MRASSGVIRVRELAQVIHEGVHGQVPDRGGDVVGHDGGLVGRRDGLEVLVEVGEHGGQLGVPLGGAIREALAAALEQPVHLAARVAQLEAAPDDLAALPDQVELARRELLGLDQHVLAHADLAEVVEQRGVADLLHLVGREADLAEGAAIGAVHRGGQRHREVGHPEGVARGGRVARLDRGDRGLHEALEQRLDGLVEAAVLERDGGLGGERGGQVAEARRIGDHVAPARRRASAKTAAGSRLQLMSWSTPITLPCGVVIGTTSMDLVR